MSPRKRVTRPVSKKPKSSSRRSLKSKAGRKTAPGHFVGRDGSPVLDRYSPKSMDAAVGEIIASLPPPEPPAVVPPPPQAAARAHAPSNSPDSTAGKSASPSAAPKILISLEKPFDIDDFSQLLGQTQITVTVPRDSLAEVLRRACDFMSFGIYVYAIRVRPGPEELLKSFVVELQRVDYSAQGRDWTPFQDRGRADNPFGPTGVR
jgi:hypothetical protein